MYILMLDDAIKANQIFENLYHNLQQRVKLFNFKLKRSPGLASIKSVTTYVEGLQKLSKDDSLCDLWNDFTCVELGGELRDNTLKDRTFISHCRRLLDGSHEMFQFSQPLSKSIDVTDVKLIKMVAEKLAAEIAQWKVHSIANTRTDFWQFDFCIADIRCVIEKCQAILDLNAQVDTTVTVEQTLFYEWWESIEKHYAVALKLNQQSS